MIVTCHNCATRLQLDDAKVPSRPFTVRCPKCAQTVNAQPTAGERQGSALAVVGDLPASTRAQQQMTTPAPATVFEAALSGAQAGGDVLQMLTELLRRGGEERPDPRGVMRRPSWERRRALVCVGSVHGAEVSRALAARDYEVFVADKTQQAFELLHEERLDVVVLDAEFDMGGQGALHLNRELNSMRMAERRRLVFVQLSPTLRTGDAQAAFLNNANLIVNTGDASELAHILERNIRDLNELYRDFNRALNVAEL
ncbi:MAG TPA: zinc-ribbon domain-containing protein [Pyrinomonadaceae bacterium]